MKNKILLLAFLKNTRVNNFAHKSHIAVYEILMCQLMSMIVLYTPLAAVLPSVISVCWRKHPRYLIPGQFVSVSADFPSAIQDHSEKLNVVCMSKIIQWTALNHL